MPSRNDSATIAHELAHAFGAVICGYSDRTILANEGEHFSAQWAGKGRLADEPPIIPATIASAGLIFDIIRDERIDVTNASHTDLLREINRTVEVYCEPASDAYTLGASYIRAKKDLAVIHQSLGMGRKAAFMALAMYVNCRKWVDQLAQAVGALPPDGTQGYVVTTDNLVACIQGTDRFRIKHAFLLKPLEAE